MVPRWQIALAGVQLCKAPPWSKKPFYLRNPPIHVVNPSLAQMEVRGKVGEIAVGKRGSKGFVEGLPQVAAAVKTGIKGFKSTKPPRRLVKPLVYEKYLRAVRGA
jgi:hypothetical protein